MDLVEHQFRTMYSRRRAQAQRLFIFCLLALDPENLWLTVPLVLIGLFLLIIWLAGVLLVELALLIPAALATLVGRVCFAVHAHLRFVLASVMAGLCVLFAVRSGWWVTAIFGLVLLIGAVPFFNPKLRSPGTRAMLLAPKSLSLALVIHSLPHHAFPAAMVLAVLVPFWNRITDGMAWAEVESQQRHRESRAHQMFQQLQIGRADLLPSYVLYLRPFSIANAQKPVDDATFEEITRGQAPKTFFNAHTGAWTSTQLPVLRVDLGLNERLSTFEANEELECTIEQAFATVGMVVALGQPGEARGAARLKIDEAEWRETVKALAHSARLCLVVPSSHAGTLWEIGWLSQNALMDRCCFWMPKRSVVFDYEREWSAAREALSGVIQLPPYDPRGCFFRYDNNGGTRWAMPDDWSQLTSEQVMTALRHLFPESTLWRPDEDERNRESFKRS